MKPKNLPEFKALIKRYESITLEEIKEKINESIDEWLSTIPNELTGFGDKETCTLCKYGCSNCVYNQGLACLKGEHRKTYYRISHADTPIKLFNAFRARAKHMKTLLKEKS